MTVIFLLVLFSSLYFLKTRIGLKNIVQPNVYSILVLFHLILHVYIGAFLIVIGVSRNSVLNQISGPNVIHDTFLYISLSIILLFFGFRFSDIFFKSSHSKAFNDFLNRPLSNLTEFGKTFIEFCFKILLFICFLSALYVTFINGEVPFIKMLFSSHSDLLLSRNDYNLNFKGIKLVKNILFEQLTPLVCLFFYGLKYKNKSLTIWFYFSFVLSIYATIFSGAKSPVVVLFINLIILKYYIEGRINAKIILASIIGIVSLLLLIVFLALGDNDFGYAAQYLFDRILVHEVSGAFLMFDIYPTIFEHIHFQSLSEFVSAIFNMDKVDNAQRATMLYAFGERAELGLFNQLSTYFLGEAWANFGILGVYIAPVYIGFVFGIFINIIIRVKKTFLSVGLLAFFSFSSSISSQFNNYIYNSTLIIIFLIIFFVLLISNLSINQFIYSQKKKNNV